MKITRSTKGIKKILFVVNVDWFFISHRLPIALAAKKEGYEVHILTKITKYLNLLKMSGLIVHSSKLSRKKSGFNLFTELFEIFDTTKAVNPDIVHLVTIKPVLLGGLVSRFLKVPAVVSAVSGLGFVYSSDGFFSVVRQRLISIIYLFALGHKNQNVIFQNIDDLNRLVGFNKKLAHKSILLPGSGINLSLYKLKNKNKNKNKNIPVVMFAGRLLESKGVKEFVQAAKLVNKNCLRARFILVGDIDSSANGSIRKIDLDKWKKDKHIEILGHRSDMHKVLPLADIITFPSYYGEGLPKVLIEAAACGRAVITTDHPGCRDAIIPNITGLLVPIKDAHFLADSIGYLISNLDICEEMGKAGRKLAEKKFDIRYIIKRHIEIYKNLLR